MRSIYAPALSRSDAIRRDLIYAAACTDKRSIVRQTLLAELEEPSRLLATIANDRWVDEPFSRGCIKFALCGEWFLEFEIFFKIVNLI